MKNCKLIIHLLIFLFKKNLVLAALNKGDTVLLNEDSVASGTTLFGDDVLSLRPGAWISGYALDFGVMNIIIPKTCEKFQYVPTMIVTRILDKPEDLEGECDINTMDFKNKILLIPYNLETVNQYRWHWILFICNTTTKTFEVYDPMRPELVVNNPKRGKEYLDKFLEFMKIRNNLVKKPEDRIDLKKWQIETKPSVKISVQTPSDCGIFVIKYIDHLVNNKFRHESALSYRKLIKKTIREKADKIKIEKDEWESWTKIPEIKPNYFSSSSYTPSYSNYFSQSSTGPSTSTWTSTSRRPIRTATISVSDIVNFKLNEPSIDEIDRESINPGKVFTPNMMDYIIRIHVDKGGKKLMKTYAYIPPKMAGILLWNPSIINDRSEVNRIPMIEKLVIVPFQYPTKQWAVIIANFKEWTIDFYDPARPGLNNDQTLTYWTIGVYHPDISLLYLYRFFILLQKRNEYVGKNWQVHIEKEWKMKKTQLVDPKDMSKDYDSGMYVLQYIDYVINGNFLIKNRDDITALLKNSAKNSPKN